MKTVLLTNGQQRKTLAAARSLGKQGVRVIVAEETRLNPTTFSKYCCFSLVCPNAKKNPEAFYYWLHKTILQYQCDIWFPMDDDTLAVAAKYYEELSKICEIPIPKPESYEAACDKGNSIRLAQEAGADSPNTVFVESLGALTGLAGNLSYPVIIKPRQASGSRGIRVAMDSEEFLEKYHTVHRDNPYPIIQEYIGVGERYDVCLLFDRKHQLKASFVQKELRHFPIPMGPSTLQESIYHPELLEMALKITEKLRWVGVIELEFMVDCKDGKLKFMEINPRFWASVQLAIFAGIDFPWLLYRIITEGDIEEHFTYQEGIRCRWLLPGDLLHFITNKERIAMSPSFWAGKREGIHDDIICKEDLLPVLGFILACLRYMFDRNMWKLMLRR